MVAVIVYSNAKMEWDKFINELTEAASYDNDSFIKEYLNFSEASEQKSRNLTTILHTALKSCSMKVAQLVTDLPQVDVTRVDAEKGRNCLHSAAVAVVKMSSTSTKAYRTLLRIIYLLFQKGADPTIKDRDGKTPLDLTETSRFNLGAALLEVLQVIWTHKATGISELRNMSTSDVCVHKELLLWAVKCDFEEIVRQILMMYPQDDNKLVVQAKIENRRRFLLGFVGEGWSLFHVAAERKCIKAFRALLAHSGILLSQIINQCPSDTKCSPGNRITPLSSILVNYDDKNNPLMDTLVQYDRQRPITNVDLSYTYIGEKLTPRIFDLENIRTLKISNAQLRKLPFSELSHYPQLLTYLDISNNNLENLPKELFICVRLEFLDVSHNPIKRLPKFWWRSRSLLRFLASNLKLDAVFDDDLSSRTSSSLVESHGYAKPEIFCRPVREISHMAVFEDQEISKLRVLDLSNNNIREFPHSFACIFPQLENLNLSKNKLQSVCYIQELPATLGRLNLIGNNLSSRTVVPFEISIPCDCFASEVAMVCGHMAHSELPRLRDLLMSQNANLNELNFTYLPCNIAELSYCEKDENNSACVYFPNLTTLEVDRCNLRDLSACGLDLTSKLRILNISYNPIRKIPLGISHLESLEDFRYDGIRDEIVYSLDQCGTVSAKRYFLKFYEDEAISDPCIRLMFVGLAERGKSSLLRYLRWGGRMDRIPAGWRERMCQENIELDFQQTVGVDQDIWYYSMSHDAACTGEGEHKMITFYAWDFAGQEEYYATHQCYLNRKALYVLCWRVTDGMNGVMELKKWLLSIQAKARDAPVVIVGTHLDLIPASERVETCGQLKLDIERMYCNGLPYYPTIKGIKFVCCPPQSQSSKDMQFVINLRKHLYSVASSMLVTIDARYPKIKLIDQKIPKRYKDVQDYIVAKAARMRRHKIPPIIKADDLKRNLRLIEELSQIDDKELHYSLEYLKDNGVLLHFDSMLLADYYFINPQWLCDVLAVIVSPIQQINRFVVQKGNATMQQFCEVVAQYGIESGEHIELILKLLCKFEIVVRLDANNILVPSLLENANEEQVDFKQPFLFPPSERQNTFSHTIQVHSKKKLFLHSNQFCYRRIFMAPHIPMSFWSRFIARCLSCNNFCRILVNCGTDISVGRCPTPNQIVVDDSLFQWYFCKTRISLQFGDHILLCVDDARSVLRDRTLRCIDTSEHNPLKCKHSEGFIVYVPSYTVVSTESDVGNLRYNNTFSPQILTHVLELIDQVMRDYFEGLLDRGIYNDNFLLQLVPCPFCFGDRYSGSVNAEDDTVARDSQLLYCFSVQFCLGRQQGLEDAMCSQVHSTNQLELRHIAPDLVFGDLAPSFKIDTKSLDHKNKKLICKGGYGTVYKMKLTSPTYPHQMVAAKIIHCSPENIATTYGLIRIELNKLSSADHPNVLQFIGLTVVPPAILIEYAPLGSLSDISKKYKDKPCPICPLSLTKILHQMGMALSYLHREQYIVHCDIKPSNVLVFAFPKAGHSCINQHFNSVECRHCQSGEQCSNVLIKLADLGTACFTGPEGFSKRPNTPGHNAPEDILYFGKELLTEKVDMFSLGTTLFELMTLRELPGIIHDVEYSNEILHGRRPRFLPKDPKYPSVFNECLYSCWNQDYRERPNASEIVEAFKSPCSITFIHSYPISTDAQQSLLVISANNSQYIWVVSENRSVIIVGEFTESQSYPVFDLTYKENIWFTDSPIKLLSQIGEMVWVATEDGRIAVCNAYHQNQELCYMNTENFPDTAIDLIKICSVDKYNAVLAYSNGVIVSAKHPDFSQDSPLLMQVKLHLNKLEATCSIQCNSSVHDIEIIPENKELWCGCDHNVIEIIDLSSCTRVASKGTLNLQSYSSDIPESSAVSQLKLASVNVYVLHNPGSVVSCWEARQHRLLTVIPLNFQASIIYSLQNHLCIGTMCGRVLAYSFSDGQITVLPGQHGTAVLKLAALQGMVTHNWLMSSIGGCAQSNDDVTISMSQDSDDIMCQVLLSLGSGYLGMFEQNQNKTLQHILMWCFINDT